MTTQTELIVLAPFGAYVRGNLITDPAAIASVLASINVHNVAQVQVSGSGTVPTPPASGTGTATSGGATLTAAQLAALANEPADAAAIAAQAQQIASLQSALASGAGGAAAVTTGTLVATGTSQATAAALPSTINVVTSVPTGSGVVLPAGGQCVVENKDPANPLLVYPPTGAAIGSGATNAPVQILSGGTAVFSALNATQWFSE